eukprot:TRINITY_DN2098_c0_g1_i4.p1 TRINITY_DN2098_c0_g1~~TRINITY_DN2098_c0_g1_i4.p1  ORF type:complete len:107 (-),score=14.16 TRINITY_DN2098_c0_g1_i4:27-347(-)
MSSAYVYSPRVEGSSLRNHVGQTVRLVGRVKNSQSGRAVLEAADHIDVVVLTNPGTQYMTEYVEVIGQVTPEGSIKEVTWTSFGDQFDLDNYRQFLQLSTNFPEIF